MLTAMMVRKRNLLCAAAGVLMLVAPGVTLAEESAQARQAIQALCDRSAARYRERDLTGYMAMYSPAYREVNVSGHIYDYRQTLAAVAADFASQRTITEVHFQLRSVFMRGASAEAVIDYHFASRSAHYTHSRDYTERTVWAKDNGGWRETGGQMLRDVQTYQRTP